MVCYGIYGVVNCKLLVRICLFLLILCFIICCIKVQKVSTSSACDKITRIFVGGFPELFFLFPFFSVIVINVMQNCCINIFYDKNSLSFVNLLIGIFNNYMNISIFHVT